MSNKLKSIIFIGAFSALFAYSSQVNGYNKYASDTCTGDIADPKASVQTNEYPLLTPEETECLDDARIFVFSYEIIRGIYDRYAKEFGNVPEAVQKDLAEADAIWYEFKKLETSSLTVPYIANFMFFWIAFHITPSGALAYCKEMYSKEMNDRFDSHFSPTCNDPFLKSNFVCHTSYQDALDNIRRLLNKYRNGHSCKW